MGPKAEPKKTRAQQKKEAQEKAEEEKKLKIEQERIEAEKKRAKEAELQRIKKIEEARLSKEEAERLQLEQTKYMDQWVMRLQEQIYFAQKKIKEQIEWDKVLDCSVKPDPCFDQELNTFMSLFTQHQELQTFQDIPNMLDRMQFCENTIEGINSMIMIARAQGQSEKEKFYRDYIQGLRVSSSEKLELISAYLSQNADILIEERQEELIKKQAENTDKKKEDKKINLELFKIYPDYNDIKYGIWINPNQKSALRLFAISFTGLGIQCEVPKPLMSQQLIMKVCHTHYSNFPIDNKIMIVGGIVDIECFEFLPQPKKTEKYTIKYMFNTKNALRKINYPPYDHNGQLNFQNAQPVKVVYQLPPYVYVNQNDTIRVALWDNETGWQSDLIDDIRYAKEKKEIVFNTVRLAPIAYYQPRCLDFPYQSWKIRCIEEETAICDIQTKRIKIKIQIKGQYCQLLSIGEDTQELEFLLNRQFLPGSLLIELQKAGINLLPEDCDAEESELQLKDNEAEDRAIEDISLAVRGFFIKSSKWSSQLNDEKVMYYIKENLEYDEEFAEDQEKDWKTIVSWKNKCALNNTKESQFDMDDSIIEGTSTHTNLYILLNEHQFCLTEATERIKDFNQVVLMDSIKRFMKLTRLISFSK